MKNYGLLSISLLAAAFGTVAKKYYTDKSGTGIIAKCNYTASSFLVAAACIAFVGDMTMPSLFTVLLSLAFGVVTALQGVAMLLAMRIGPVSYTMMFASFSTVITALSGTLFFDERLTLLKVFGIALMLTSFVFATENGAEKKKTNLSWLLLCITVFLSTGGIGLMQKIHQTSDYKAELDVFLVLAFITTAIVCVFVAAISWSPKAREGDSAKMNKKTLLFLLAVTVGGGVSVAINNKLNLFLSGVMDTSVFFPIANGGAVVLSTLAAFLLFRERLSRKRWIGLLIGVASVVLLCI